MILSTDDIENEDQPYLYNRVLNFLSKRHKQSHKVFFIANSNGKAIINTGKRFVLTISKLMKIYF